MEPVPKLDESHPQADRMIDPLEYPARVDGLRDITMLASQHNDWFSAGLDALALGAESSAVMALRSTRIALGGSAALEEFSLMFTEKMSAMLELQAAAMSGDLGDTPATATRNTIGFYRHKVRANQERLQGT